VGNILRIRFRNSAGDLYGANHHLVPTATHTPMHTR
jgi:hypothetical protein